MTVSADATATFSVTVLPSGRAFSTQAHETILAAGIRQGIGLPYGCKDGACGSCKCKLLSGSVHHSLHQAKALSEQEEAAGLVLTCCATPQSDVMVLQLQLPANDNFAYRAGQYVEFILRDGARRSYSMANAPGQGASIELHIRHMPGGKFTDHVFGTMKEKEILRLEGPYGSFFLREDSDKPIVLLASGTGFAPVKALLEHMLAQGIARPVALYWGGRRPADLYMDAWVSEMQHRMPQLRWQACPTKNSLPTHSRPRLTNWPPEQKKTGHAAPAF